jgi:hypothetical protein
MNGSPARYAIRVAGRLGPTSLAAFPDLHCEANGSETVLTGEVLDSPALYGIVGQLEALGPELIEIRPLTAAPAAPSPTSAVGGADGPGSGALC